MKDETALKNALIAAVKAVAENCKFDCAANCEIACGDLHAGNIYIDKWGDVVVDCYDYFAKRRASIHLDTMDTEDIASVLKSIL